MKIKLPDIQWLAVIAGIAVVFLVAVQIKLFVQKDKSRFDLNKFSGTHLAIERDEKRRFTTFAHAGVLELTQASIGMPKNDSYREYVSDRGATIPLEALYFSGNDLKPGGKLQEFSVHPITDRLFLNGIQNFTRIKVSDIQPERDAWMIGAIAKISGIERRIISIGVNELMVEGLLDEFPKSNIIQVELNAKKSQAGLMGGIPVSAISDTVFWQNGVWVFDDRAFLFAANVADTQPGDSIVFQDGVERIVQFVRSDGVIELDGGRLNPNLHGFGSRIFVKKIAREERNIKRFVNILPFSDADFHKGINRYQRVLMPDKATAIIAEDDYVMFPDGILRPIYAIGEGYIDVEVLRDTKMSENQKDVGLIEKKLGDPSANLITHRLLSVQPFNSRTLITGNKFLHIRGDQAVPESSNGDKAQAHLKKQTLESTLATTPKIWATYTGIVNVLYDSVHPVNRDYLIHVLGSSERRKYVENFVRVKPDYVQTSVDNFDYSNFHAWSLNSSWNFYEQVLLNYSPIYSYDYMMMWQKKPGEWLTKFPTSPTVIGASFPVTLPTSSSKSQCEFELYTVTVDYEVNNPWKVIPVFGRTDRYLINKKGAENALPVSLPPEERSWSFPLLRRAGVPVELTLDEIHPIANFSKISIKQISEVKLPVEQETIRRMFFPTYFSEDTVCQRKTFEQQDQ